MKTFRKIGLLLMVALMATALSSCNDDEGSDLIGRWTSSFSASGDATTDISGVNIDMYDFYDGGNGNYYYYDESSVMQTKSFGWGVNKDETAIVLNFSDGTTTTYSYKIDNNGYLCLSANSTFATYTAYRKYNGKYY